MSEREHNDLSQAWIDNQGDVWRLGDDGLMHSYETAPFPREYVEKKWGPLKPPSADRVAVRMDRAVSAELVDPFATHEPDLTPDEWVAIRDEIREHTFGDPSLLPDCLVEAVKVLGEIGTSNTPNPASAATQCLRRLAYRAKTGVPFHEPQEPAWSLDPDPRPYERVLSDDERGGY